VNYLLFVNPVTGSSVLSKLVKKNPPEVVITIFKKFDSWQRIAYRFITNRLTVEDKLRLFYKIEFYDYKCINREMLKRIVEKNNIEIGFISSFSFIIPKELFEIFPKGLYNFHPSLLPAHGGANPLFWIVYNGDEYTGTTCHQVTTKVDCGRILLQTKYKVGNKNAKDLFNKYVNDVTHYLPDICQNFDRYFDKSFEMKDVSYDPKIPNLEKLKELAKNDKEVRKRINKALKLIKRRI